MSCCRNPSWKHFVSTGAITAEAMKAAAATLPRLVRQPSAGDGPDRIFYNGTFLLATAARDGEEVTAVAVTGELVSDVGDAARILASKTPATELVDLQGATLSPGFIEAHAHIISATQATFSHDVGFAKCQSFEAVLAAIEAELATAQPGDWRFFMNFDPSLFGVAPGEPFPQLGFDSLDLLPRSKDVNVFVENASGHIAYANRTAFTTVNVQAGDDPGGGGWYATSDGKLTGVMFEPPAFTKFLDKAKMVPAAAFGAMVDFLRLCAKVGCTTVADPAVGIGGNLPEELAIYDLFAALPIFTDVVGSIDLTMLYPPGGTAPSIPALQAPTTAGATGRFGALIVPGLKVWADGSTQGYTGYLTEPYLAPVTPTALAEKSVYGEPDWKQPDLDGLVLQARGGNWGMQIHANGDAGLDMALSAIELAYGGDGSSGFRNRIEHCTVTRPEQYDTMKRLGVTPSYLTNHIAIWGDAFRDNILGEPRARRLDAVADALARDMLFSFHCDYATSMPAPLQYLQTAVTRATSSGKVLGPELQVSPLDALRGLTIHPATQLGIDALVGTIEVGKRANLVQLAANPLTVAHDAIAAIAIVDTFVAGRRVERD